MGMCGRLGASVESKGTSHCRGRRVKARKAADQGQAQAGLVRHEALRTGKDRRKAGNGAGWCGKARVQVRRATTRKRMARKGKGRG